jgi:transposase
MTFQTCARTHFQWRGGGMGRRTSSHGPSRTRRTPCRRRQVVLHACLPAYSPNLNPIELVFATLKPLLRQADERSVEATWRRIADLLGAFTPKECAAYLRHAGYASVSA